MGTKFQNSRWVLQILQQAIGLITQMLSLKVGSHGKVSKIIDRDKGTIISQA